MNKETRKLLKRVAQLQIIKGDYVGMCGGNDVYDRDRYSVEHVSDVVRRAKKILAEDSEKLKSEESS